LALQSKETELRQVSDNSELFKKNKVSQHSKEPKIKQQNIIQPTEWIKILPMI
jgi:hypothetical protein